MDFAISSEQQAIVDSIRGLMGDFGDDFWLERDDTGEFPEEFYQAMAKGGWLCAGRRREPLRSAGGAGRARAAPITGDTANIRSRSPIALPDVRACPG